MTPQQNFRLGFLLRCAEEGCDVEEIKDRVKLATWTDPMSYAAPLLNVGKSIPYDAKRQELPAAFKLQADLARRRAAQRQYRLATPASPHF